MIEIEHKTPRQMATAYNFTARQNEQLALLADPQYDVLWMELLGGFTSGSGEIISPDTDWTGRGVFAWPLPKSFTITSRFGYREDPFTGRDLIPYRNKHRGPDGHLHPGSGQRNGDRRQRYRSVERGIRLSC